MELLARIAKDRIGVLIGKSGETKLEIENLANEKCAEPVDKRQSGKYLILHLCL